MTNVSLDAHAKHLLYMFPPVIMLWFHPWDVGLRGRERIPDPGGWRDFRV